MGVTHAVMLFFTHSNSWGCSSMASTRDDGEGIIEASADTSFFFS